MATTWTPHGGLSFVLLVLLLCGVAGPADAAGGDPDTVWIGHVGSITGLPGTPGGYGPHRIGRGANRIIGGVLGPPSAYEGVWGFDHFQPGETDSLQGWYSVAAPYTSVGSASMRDAQRPFFFLDYGNQGNYVGNTPSHPKTFGVTGYWHADGGASQPPIAAGADHNPAPLTWNPLSGARSAWCGLRSHGDVTVQDVQTSGGTGNYFNQSVLDFNGASADPFSTPPAGTRRNFPGYGSQWDQMLYRDVVLFDGQDLAISFKYQTAMSIGQMKASHLRGGWFHWDPLKPVSPNDGNFISASDAPMGVVDSFAVYVGVPVQEASCAYTDGSFAPLYDPVRRWLSEVIRYDAASRQLFSTYGTQSSQTAFFHLPNALIQPILDSDGPGNGGRVRIVFRVKTNRGFDDEDHGQSGYTSGTAGAAIVDDVTANGSVIGDFEAAGAIDNRPSIPPTTAWKSTGKPPGVYFHVEAMDFLPYDDPCGSVGSPNRLCNLWGRVVNPGDHDQGEKPGGLFGSNSMDRQVWFASPVINLRSTGEGDFNGMGIDAEIAGRAYLVWMDLYQNLYDFDRTGNGFRVGWQSYPAVQANGVRCWGEVQQPEYFGATGGVRGCFAGGIDDLPGSSPQSSQLILTSNPNGVPDSLRVFIESISRCFGMNLTAVSCSPSSGPKAGAYADNLSLGFVRASPPPPLSVDLWDVYNDAFPVNALGFVEVPGPAFDTLTAHMRSARNIAPATGNVFRHNIPGDSVCVTAKGSGIRLDLVFRILPGPGNYVVIGNRGSGLRRVPTGSAPASANAASQNFWESYLADNGAFGTGGSGTGGPGHPGGAWDPNRWNSARMDTAETNLFPATGVDASLAKPVAGRYAGMYHESDVKYATLGIARNRCFLIDVSSSAGVGAGNVSCGQGTYPPAVWGGPGTGLAPTENGLPPGRTFEYTKILPDGQFTPGTHVEYFFRRSPAVAPNDFDLAPDTNRVFPQRGFDSDDGLRWLDVAVLPDRWKDPAFGAGGTGMACMLVIDLADRRGDELKWASLSDSIGLTNMAKRGAHNGWRARGDESIQGDVGSNDAIAVRPHLGQPGTVWDLYQVRGGESNASSGRLGSRLASQANPGLASGKFATFGPSSGMLRHLYRTVVLLGADLGPGVFGPYVDQSDDDVGLLTDFMTNPTGGGLPRGVITVGMDLVEGQSDPSTGHPSFFPSQFGVGLRDGDFRGLTSHVGDVADLTATPPVGTSSALFGVATSCFLRLDVYDVQSGSPAPVASGFYSSSAPGGPFVASAYFPDGGSRIVRTLVQGWTLGPLGGQGSHLNIASSGARLYWFDALTNVFGSLNCGPMGPPIGVGDGVGARGTDMAGFMRFGSRNPSRGGLTRIKFLVPVTGPVELTIYDLSGRKIRTLTRRTFQGGQEHEVVWDGRDDQSSLIPPGVYFYRLRSDSFTSQKTIVLLGL